MIDLTHDLSQKMPAWDGECGFRHKNKFDYEECNSTVKFRAQKVTMDAGIGTHIDAPSHCIPGAKTVGQIPLESLLAPLIVIDTHKKMTGNYQISEHDIENFEEQYGEIPKNSFVAFYTGWSQHWHNPEKYRNNLVFPSINEAVANILVDRNVNGIGIDTLSPDTPISNFPVHRIILGANKYIIENINNLERMPVIGAYVLALPLKGPELTEAPVRMIGLISR